MTDTVLLTGITGFVGGHTALALLNAGYRVRGSLRDFEKADRVRETMQNAGANTQDLEFVELDLLSDAGWAEAIAGCRYLQHIASPFVIEAPADPDELIRPAVQGTERAIKAALAENVDRVVLTSSMAAIMYGHPRSRTAPFTEDDWSMEGDLGAYVASKLRAERRAWELIDAAGRHDDLVVINPGSIQGPLLDNDPGTSGQLTKRLLDGSVPGAPRFGFPTIDVRDVAAAHLEAMRTPDAAGHRYPMSAGTIWMKEIADLFRQTFPDRAGKIPRFGVPDWFVRILARFDSDMRDNLVELGIDRQVDASRARALLGRDFVPAGDSFVAMAKSLIERGLV